MSTTHRGIDVRMGEPQREQSMADVAGEPTQESVQRERDVVGDHPDTGGLVDEDRSQ